jgi:hypothetical protein
MASIHHPSAPTTPAAGMRRLAHAALLAGVLALGFGVSGHLGTASADWDIETFDNCMHQKDADEGVCCVLSDGVWGANGHCQATPARILQHIPLGPKLGLSQQLAPATNTLSPVS